MPNYQVVLSIIIKGDSKSDTEDIINKWLDKTINRLPLPTQDYAAASVKKITEI